MAYNPNHMSQEMDMHHFSDENSAVLRSILPEQLAQSSPDVKPLDHQQPPTWLNSAILRQESHYTGTGGRGAGENFLNLHSNLESSAAASQASNQWLSRSILQRNVSDVQTSNNSSAVIATADLKNDDGNNNNDNGNNNAGGQLTDSEVVGGGGDGTDGILNWQNAGFKAEILAHPLFEQLLSAHVACLRIATPVDQLPRIDAQLAQSQQVVAKYSSLGQNIGDDKELDQFLTHYVLLLCSFKEQLQQHVRVHAMEAVMACWEIEQSLQSLTGVSPGEGTGATMSDDEDDQVDSEANLFDGSIDGHDGMGFGLPTESERSLMERVRQELKHELKQGYKEKLVDIREEILRKRRAGKLPGDTTSVLKAWWQSHAKWPYPTEEDKAKLVQETGLQLKQINNWFINQRKRNWHSNPSSSTTSKSKRKR